MNYILIDYSQGLLHLIITYHPPSMQVSAWYSFTFIDLYYFIYIIFFIVIWTQQETLKKNLRKKYTIWEGVTLSKILKGKKIFEGLPVIKILNETGTHLLLTPILIRTASRKFRPISFVLISKLNAPKKGSLFLSSYLSRSQKLHAIETN